jgi:hypothetical protein
MLASRACALGGGLRAASQSETARVNIIPERAVFEFDVSEPNIVNDAVHFGSLAV